ncbi:hypothetical protein HYU96_04485 [Candidatus Daviesbacteria bacterium]|nr:hypothetical protein [Candidatus Daviesbacteria bacterium]
MWVWDYKINKAWKPITDDGWQWFLVRKINYGDFAGITKDMLKKYFPKIKKWLDSGKKTMIENFLQR